MTLLERFPAYRDTILQLVDFIDDIASGRRDLQSPEARRLALHIGATLVDSGHLNDILSVILRLAFRAGMLPAAISADNLPMYTQQLAEAIDAETSARGATTASRGVQYEEWGTLAKRLLTDLQRKVYPILGQHRTHSGFRNDRFVRLFEQETRAPFRNNTQMRLLIDGPASFAERERQIRKATRSIHILSWAFYDDTTGDKFANLLIEKRRSARVSGRPIDIKVMVDGLIARHPPHDKTLRRMEENGIEVIRWRSVDPLRRYDGQHRKIMIFDGEESIEGGMNFGDPYSHLGSPNSPKWRDTDVLVRGEGVTDSNHLFARLWNEQIGKRRDLPKGLEYVRPVTAHPVVSPQSPRASLVNHQPARGENILRANLLAIEAAKDTVDIENAYFILDPATHDALLRAKQRGVRVRILTNSVESIDVPEMAYLIMRGVNQMVADGMEVYLKKGDTLHSKMMNVDGIYSWVGSHNFHPRSFRYEGEVIRTVLDEGFGSKLVAAFENDLLLARRIDKPVPIPRSPVVDLLQLWFHDQL